MAKKRRTGRPTKLKKAYYEQVTKLAMLGAIEKEIADFFHVTEATITNWKSGDPLFLSALNAGREKADADVANSLYKRAMGTSVPDTHFSAFEGTVTATPTRKHFPPDPTSCIFWLKNRRRQNWRDEAREAPPPPAINPTDMMELARRIAFIMCEADSMQQPAHPGLNS